MRKLKINPFFWLIIIGAIVTGQFFEIISLFAVVMIHELGHLFAAKSYGWKLIEIELLPFGGVARVEQKNDSIWEEFIVAIAGPLQNAILIFIAIGFKKLNLWSDEWTTFFIQANTIIGLFNLIPISPLDGNKILKALLFLFLPFKKAIMASIFISIVVMLFFIIWASGILINTKVNINGIILGIFFIYSNVIDIKQSPYLFWTFILKKANRKTRNTAALQVIVSDDLSIIKALNLLRRERYHLFYILSPEGKIKKIIPEERLLMVALTGTNLNDPISFINI